MATKLGQLAAGVEGPRLFVAVNFFRGSAISALEKAGRWRRALKMLRCFAAHHMSVLFR